MLSQKTIEIVKSTAPVLKEHGLEITKTFYKIMFENNPEVKGMFNMDKQESGEQPKALAMTILAAAQNIDRLEVLLPFEGPQEEYKDIKNLYDDIIKIANKYYDYVFVDLDQEVGEENERNILKSSDVIMTNISQRPVSLNEYLEEKQENRILQNTNVIPLIGRYDKYSKYTTKNIARYIGNKSELSTIPYNTLFFEAAEEAKVVDLFLRIRKISDIEDRNVHFINEVEKVSKKIMYKVQETQQRRKQ